MKPGYKTSEFWLSLAALLLSALAASGALGEGTGLEKLLALALSTLAALGYTGARVLTKRAEAAKEVALSDPF